jgi:carbonic anhydrase/acetyltransferase-like protein (isoleucine patch superfamily)
MLLTHLGKTPRIDPSAYVSPNAAVCGDVAIGADCRILFGAQIVAEGGSIAMGRECIVMENAVLRANQNHPLEIGNNCLIGPNAHLVGCRIEDEVFIATGAAVFHAAWIAKGSEIRVNAVVHLKTHLPPGATVPIGWVAVGDPAVILPPDQHERIWEIQRPLNFPLTVYGFPREEADMVKITKRLSAHLAQHRDDRMLPSPS